MMPVSIGENFFLQNKIVQVQHSSYQSYVIALSNLYDWNKFAECQENSFEEN